MKRWLVNRGNHSVVAMEQSVETGVCKVDMTMRCVADQTYTSGHF